MYDIEFYPWNLCHFNNQCHRNKFSKEKKKQKTKKTLQKLEWSIRTTQEKKKSQAVHSGRMQSRLLEPETKRCQENDKKHGSDNPNPQNKLDLSGIVKALRVSPTSMLTN